MKAGSVTLFDDKNHCFYIVCEDNNEKDLNSIKNKKLFQGHAQLSHTGDTRNKLNPLKIIRRVEKK